RRSIYDCPVLDPAVAARFAPEVREDHVSQAEVDGLETLKQMVARSDLKEAAARIGGNFSGEGLTIKILGKDFGIDTQGNICSDIHVNPWITGPFLIYVMNCQGSDVVGEWVSFRELRGGKERYPLFRKRCEEAMKRVADIYTDFFNDITDLFQGRQVDSLFESDISVVLPVLPKVPLMICYWKKDEGMGSSLNVFFDRTVDDNLGAEAAFTLGAGLTQMFERLALKHGLVVAA
ncbi:MAG: DUF3786 domain-containing protein, partial [Deltaproteobacteria bacterium]|nr:DUF3786 domain-containing protein [Deltaproteobacteria bacterium]